MARQGRVEMRVILEWTEDRDGMIDQINAAQMAVSSIMFEGEIFGVRVNGSYFGVKRNKGSVRVYPQSPPPDEGDMGGRT